jgi:hypothetical protein
MENKNIYNYLRKFEKKYQIAKGSDGVTVLQGKYGEIEPTSKCHNGILVFICANGVNTSRVISPAKYSRLLRLLRRYSQGAIKLYDIGFELFIHEDDLDAVASIVGIYKMNRTRKRYANNPIFNSIINIIQHYIPYSIHSIHN